MNQTIPAQPLVSVIIPAHNAEPFIGSAIDSALSQTYENIEVLVVDDGSHDRTADIVSAIAVRDHRVKLFRQTQQGVAAARNKAILGCRGEHVAPLDADDIWHPHKLENQLRCMMDAGPSVGLVYAWSVYIDERGCPTGLYYAIDVPRHIYAALLFKNFIGCASVPLIRRECFERVGNYNPARIRQNAQGCEDLDLYLRIAERYEFRVVREFLVKYRQSNQSMSWNIDSMAKSFYLTMADCKRRRADIPWSIFRWSIGRHYLYLQGQARRYGQYWQSIKLLLRAGWFEPGFLTTWHFYRHLIASVLRPRKILKAMYQHLNGNHPETRAVQAQQMVANIAPGKDSQTTDRLTRLYQRRLTFTERLLDGNMQARGNSLDERLN